MIALLAALVLPSPSFLHVSTTHGRVDIALVHDRAQGPLVPLNALARALGANVLRDDPWITLQTGAGAFRFLPGTPVVQDGADLRGLPAMSRRTGDSLLVPLAFVAEVLADAHRQTWKWSPHAATLTPEASHPAAARAVLLPNGLRAGHRVTIDPGHGGTDPGNPGMFFPRGLKEKDVTLAVGLLVRDDLERQGVRVTMTRTTDTLINLGERAPRYCTGDCDIFVSIHVNSLEPRPGFTAVRGFETYFLSEARSADAARVARMENEAARFDRPDAAAAHGGGLDFIFSDLLNNQFQRESQRAAALIQSSLAEVHDGDDHGVKQAGFAVLNTARRPSVLIEMGYSTNRDDARLMTTPQGQRNLADAIARAIVEYLKSYDRETADSTVDATP